VEYFQIWFTRNRSTSLVLDYWENFSVQQHQKPLLYFENRSFSYCRRTPLHLAAIGGNAPAAELLFEHGARFDFKDDLGNTPLDEARSVGNQRFLDLAARLQSGKGKQVAP
jgi:hypothetical protein